ncbi:MAG: hypothetical protein WCC95_10395 [Candidatus Sulfotelmatobacter sp.]
MRPQYVVGLLCIVFIFATGLYAQNAISAGTILPVRLNTSLNSRKARPGEIITARVMQDIPRGSGARVRAGAKVIGRVVDVKNSEPPQISVQFDALVVSGRKVPITTNLRALASMMDVEAAQIPAFGPDRGTPPNWQTTEQIGGEVVYRGGGPVENGLVTVGEPTGNGMLAYPTGKAGTNCRGLVNGSDRPQAFWVFSSDACGVYGFNDLTIAHAGRSDPAGIITLASNRGHINVRSGSGMLLRVD